MTRLECKQLCVLKLGDIVGYAKPQKVKPGINWGQTAAVTNTLHTHTRTCVLSVGLSSLRAKLKTIQYDTQENVQIHTLVNVHGSLLGSCSF